MAELSDRFAALMARMARSDAEMFRTIGEQNASVRQLVDELGHGDPSLRAPASAAPLPSAGLLPPEQCDLKALKVRFGRLTEAQQWLEQQIGPAPKKPTWAVVQQTCREGTWPTSGPIKSSASKALSAAQLDERLASLEQRLEPRLQAMEGLLALIAEVLLKPQGSKDQDHAG